MENLSVIVNGIDNNERFLNKLFTEVGADLTFDVEKDVVSFKNIDDKNKEALSKGLAKAIISEYERNILVKVINKSCDCFSKRDKIEIWKMTMRQLLDDEYSNNDDYIYRVEIIRSKIAEYINTSDVLSLEGFINFRLNDYNEELEEAVDASVREYMLEAEYMEFVNTLKYFVSMQTPKYLVVDIFLDDDISIYADNVDITKECRDEFNSEMCFDTDNNDDFLLNSLISIAPKRINIHFKGNYVFGSEFKETLAEVFGNKLNYCFGCKKCK